MNNVESENDSPPEPVPAAAPVDPNVIPPLHLDLPYESPPLVPLTSPDEVAYIKKHKLVHGSKFFIYHEYLRVAATLEADGHCYAARIHYAAKSAFVRREPIVVSE